MGDEWETDIGKVELVTQRTRPGVTTDAAVEVSSRRLADAIRSGAIDAGFVIMWEFYCHRPTVHPIVEPRTALAPLLDQDESFTFTSEDSAILWGRDWNELWSRNCRHVNEWVARGAADPYVQQFDLKMTGGPGADANVAVETSVNCISVPIGFTRDISLGWPGSESYLGCWRPMESVFERINDGFVQLPLDRLLDAGRVTSVLAPGAVRGDDCASARTERLPS